MITKNLESPGIGSHYYKSLDTYCVFPYFFMFFSDCPLEVRAFSYLDVNKPVR